MGFRGILTLISAASRNPRKGPSYLIGIEITGSGDLGNKNGAVECGRDHVMDGRSLDHHLSSTVQRYARAF